MSIEHVVDLAAVTRSWGDKDLAQRFAMVRDA